LGVRSFEPAGMLPSMGRMSISQACMQSTAADLGEKRALDEKLVCLVILGVGVAEGNAP